MQLDNNGLITLDRKAILKPYEPRQHPEREFLTDAEILSNVGGTLFLNCESYPNYFLITFKLHGTNKFLQLECETGRSFNPQFLSWLLFNYRTVGFNSLNFDLLLIWLAYRFQDAAVLKEATEDIIIGGIREWELKKKFKFQTFKTNHIDILEVAPLRGALKLYGARLHTKSIQEQPFDINADLTEFEISELKQFNCTQLNITNELFDFMKERIELREAIGNEYGEDLRSKSDTQMAEIVLSKEISRLNGKQIERPDLSSGPYCYNCPQYLQFQTPVMQNFLEVCKKAKFMIGANGYLETPKGIDAVLKIADMEYSFGIGGLHSKEKNIAYKANETKKLTDRDVTSYYPNCILNLGLYPVGAGPNFLKVFRGFKDSRVEAKRAKNFTKDKGLKIFLNGTSGKFSDLFSKLRSPQLTMQMNLTCQLSILLLIEMLTLNSFQVISANTDGIVIYHDRADQEKLDAIIKLWEQQTKFDTEETEYKAYYGRDVNSYFAVKTDGSIKKKGPYSEVGSQSGTKLDTNPIALVCSDAVEALLANNVPIEETIKGCKDFTRFITVRQAKAPGAHWKGEYLGRVLRWAYMLGETGCIQTVAANNKVADSDGARPCLDLPDSFPEDINYEWYLSHTKEILYDIGYLSRPKQIEFF